MVAGERKSGGRSKRRSGGGTCSGSSVASRSRTISSGLRGVDALKPNPLSGDDDGIAIALAARPADHTRPGRHQGHRRQLAARICAAGHRDLARRVHPAVGVAAAGSSALTGWQPSPAMLPAWTPISMSARTILSGGSCYSCGFSGGMFWPSIIGNVLAYLWCAYQVLV